MEKMEGVHAHLLLLLVTLIQGIQGQVIRPLSVNVSAGGMVSLECTTSAPDGFTFSWIYVDTVAIIYTDGNKIAPVGTFDNFMLDEDKSAKRSTLIINDILLQDKGHYRCTVSGETNLDDATVNVEVGSASQPMVLESIDSDTKYRATCDAIGSSPEETITWILDGDVQTAPPADIVETDPQISNDPLFDKRSVFTFPATSDNYNTRLECNIGGHQVTELNRQESRLVDIHNPPEANGIMISFNSDGTNLEVSCNINPDVDAAIPAMDIFYIYENGTLVDKSPPERTVSVTEPEQDTEYMCVGLNYLGNTTATDTFVPGRTTTPSPPTEPITTEGPSPSPTDDSDLMTSPGPNDDRNNTARRSAAAALSVGEIVGIVIGAILGVIIIVLVIYFVWKKGTCSGNPGPSGASSTKKHGSSTVGTSNGSEKDKIKPVAAPRDQGSIQHTTDNPGQAEYAMVDRKKPGGSDMPDTRGPGQKEPPQGMLYADLDLSASAGHTEKKVPQNKDDVVVYSSILV